MQCVFYVGIGFTVALVDYVFGTHRSLEHIFSFQLLQFRGTHGKLLMVASVLNALIGGVGLWHIVRRTKQCWDFTTTIYVIHLLICWCVSGSFPNTVSWWFISVACGVIMTVFGEYLCMRTELKAIPLVAGSKVDL